MGTDVVNRVAQVADEREQQLAIEDLRALLAKHNYEFDIKSYDVKDIKFGRIQLYISSGGLSFMLNIVPVGYDYSKRYDFSGVTVTVIEIEKDTKKEMGEVAFLRLPKLGCAECTFFKMGHHRIKFNLPENSPNLTSGQSPVTADVETRSLAAVRELERILKMRGVIYVDSKYYNPMRLLSLSINAHRRTWRDGYYVYDITVEARSTKPNLFPFKGIKIAAINPETGKIEGVASFNEFDKATITECNGLFYRLELVNPYGVGAGAAEMMQPIAVTTGL